MKIILWRYAVSTGNIYWHFTGLYCLHHQGQALHEGKPSDPEDGGITLRRNIGDHQSTQRNIPESLDIQEHRCDNSKNKSDMFVITVNPYQRPQE